MQVSRHRGGEKRGRGEASMWDLGCTEVRNPTYEISVTQPPMCKETLSRQVQTSSPIGFAQKSTHKFVFFFHFFGILTNL